MAGTVTLRRQSSVELFAFSEKCEMSLPRDYVLTDICLTFCSELFLLRRRLNSYSISKEMFPVFERQIPIS